MKKYSIYVLIIGILFFILVFIKEKMDLKRSFQEITKIYGSGIAKNVEKIYRLETNHFKSKQFNETYSAGMEIFKKSFPYGWGTLKNLWKNNSIAPIGTFEIKENQTGITKTFLKFPTLTAGFIALAEILKLRNNDAGSWFSNIEKNQELYQKKLDRIRTIYT